MAIPLRDPVPTVNDWNAYKTAVKVSRGTACYTAMALHFRTSAPNAFDRIIDGRKPYTTTRKGVPYLEKSRSGKYRAWLRGTSPSDRTCDAVLKASIGVLDLRFWRDTSLWELLAKKPPAIERLQNLRENASLTVRKILFGTTSPNRQNRFVHEDLSRDNMLALRDLGTVDAFVVILSLARQAEVLNDDSTHALAVTCAFDSFPRLLMECPPLALHWEKLYACLDFMFWRRLYDEGLYLNFSIERARSNLEALRVDPDATLDRMSGRRTIADSPSSIESKVTNFAAEWRQILEAIGRPEFPTTSG